LAKQEDSAFGRWAGEEAQKAPLARNLDAIPQVMEALLWVG
jgi:hypothetical protein